MQGESWEPLGPSSLANRLPLGDAETCSFFSWSGQKLTTSAVDLVDEKTLCPGGCPGPCRRSSSIPAFHRQAEESPPSCDNQNCPQTLPPLKPLCGLTPQVPRREDAADLHRLKHLWKPCVKSPFQPGGTNGWGGHAEDCCRIRWPVH